MNLRWSITRLPELAHLSPRAKNYIAKDFYQQSNPLLYWIFSSLVLLKLCALAWFIMYRSRSGADWLAQYVSESDLAILTICRPGEVSTRGGPLADTEQGNARRLACEDVDPAMIGHPDFPLFGSHTRYQPLRRMPVALCHPAVERIGHREQEQRVCECAAQVTTSHERD